MKKWFQVLCCYIEEEQFKNLIEFLLQPLHIGRHIFISWIFLQDMSLHIRHEHEVTAETHISVGLVGYFSGSGLVV